MTEYTEQDLKLKTLAELGEILAELCNQGWENEDGFFVTVKVHEQLVIIAYAEPNPKCRPDVEVLDRDETVMRILANQQEIREENTEEVEDES